MTDVAAGLWAADAHEYGPGKVHLIDAEDRARTLCGKWLRAVPGKSASVGRATCKICLNAVENRTHRRLMNEEFSRQREQSERERAQRSAEWWANYNSYLRSAAWREKSEAVKRRSGGMCEGCGNNRATQVHHLTYKHVCEEFLWELRAVCDECHERVHGRGDA